MARNSSSSSFAHDVAAIGLDSRFVIVDSDEYGTDTDTLSREWEIINKSDGDADEEVSLPDEETLPTLLQFGVLDGYVLNSSLQNELTDVSQELPRIEEKAVLEGYLWDVEKRYVLEDDEEDEQEESDLDDELVPWAVSDKLGRERMRKFGARRDFAKMHKAKRMICMYNNTKPGYVRGKRGLGMKHRF